MRKYPISALFVLAFGAAFWAYVIIDNLIRIYSGNATLIDLLAILVLGFIAGLGCGLAVAVRRWLKEPYRGG